MLRDNHIFIYIVSLVTCSLKWLLIGSRKLSHLWKRAGNSKQNDKTKLNNKIQHNNKTQHNNKIKQDSKTQQNKKGNKQTYINNFKKYVHLDK